MKRVLVSFAILISIASASAEEQKQPAVAFTGLVDLAAIFNANRPGNHQNFVPGTGTTGSRGNELSLNLVQVQWTRGVSAQQPIGFTLALVAGEGTDVVHSGEPGGASKFRYLYQASVAYRVSDRLLLEAGVYPSHIGLEGFYSKDSWNYTRSWLGEFSPYYQAGIKGTYTFNDHWSAQLHVLNGWQLINDNNDGKAIGTQIAWSSGPWSTSFNTFIGPELPRDNTHLRMLGDLVATWKTTPRLSIAASVDRGRQDLPGNGAANWLGAAGFGRFAIDERHAFAVRVERFRDPRNGISGAGQKLTEATLTYEVHPITNLNLKFEGRHDHSTAPVFTNRSDGVTSNETLALIGVVVTF